MCLLTEAQKRYDNLEEADFMNNTNSRYFTEPEVKIKNERPVKVLKFRRKRVAKVTN